MHVLINSSYYHCNIAIPDELCYGKNMETQYFIDLDDTTTAVICNESGNDKPNMVH